MALLKNTSNLNQISQGVHIQEEEKGGKKPILVDGHVDITYFMMNLPEKPFLSELEDGPFTLGKIREIGLRLFSNALYCEDKYNGEGSMRHLEEILKFTVDHFDPITVIKESHDLERLQKDPDIIGALLLLENADALAGNLSHIDDLINSGIRIVGLTHAGKNRLADGNAIVHSDGITDEGRDVIRTLSESALLIDVAHLHPRCFWQLMDLTEAVLISSHTGMRKVYDIQRNIDMDQVKEIIGREGLVGISVNPEMLSPDGKANLENIFIHVDVLVQKFGPDGVGIGSDFCGFDQKTEGLEDITRLPKLMDIMMNHGYGDEAVEKIMGLNWLRIYQRLFGL